MGRQTFTPYEAMSEERQQAFNRIAEGRKVVDGKIGGPFDVWLMNPELATRAVGLGGMFRFRTSVDRRIIEMAILITGQFWQAQFEWFAHAPMARQAGLAEHIIEAVKAGNKPDPMADDEAAVWALCTELHHHHRVSDAVFANAKEAFGEQGVAEIVGLIGYYTLVSMTLNTFDVDLPAGAKKPFPDA
ncbi:MAG: carboxymuconolactone decarboxylase family protein [Gammaproteobacteria bacterium]|nr:carboxymuconolactone decarboxylase family protein [Gammaproteobacteria bacterium]